MTNRPPRPATYQRPKEWHIELVKKPMQKPYWILHTDNHGPCICQSRTQAMQALAYYISLAALSDDQLYMALWRSCGGTLVNSWAYDKRKGYNGDIYVDRDDKHEWHRADEVEMLRWLAEQKHKEVA